MVCYFIKQFVVDYKCCFGNGCYLVNKTCNPLTNPSDIAAKAFKFFPT